MLKPEEDPAAALKKIRESIGHHNLVDVVHQVKKLVDVVESVYQMVKPTLIHWELGEVCFGGYRYPVPLCGWDTRRQPIILMEEPGGVELVTCPRCRLVNSGGGKGLSFVETHLAGLSEEKSTVDLATLLGTPFGETASALIRLEMKGLVGRSDTQDGTDILETVWLKTATTAAHRPN